MEKQPNATSRIFQFIVIVLGLFALIGQFWILTGNRVTSIPEMIIRYFSFFTISTNTLAVTCFMVLFFAPGSKWGSFFGRQQTMAAITVYMVIVGLIYNTILRFLWAPAGFQRIVDELLHAVMPVLVLIYWLVFVQKNNLQWKNLLPWLIYPFVYIIYTLARGPIANFYPYPFLDVKQLGWSRVLVNSAGITILFIVMSLAIIAVGKFTNRKLPVQA